jgi:hypothetical protein
MLVAAASVSAEKLGSGAVTSRTIAAGAVTAGAIAPQSIGAAQLGEVEVVSKSDRRPRQIAHNGEWTASDGEIAACGPGSRLLGGGFSTSTLTNGEFAWIEELPIVNGEVNGIAGRFTSDAGGAATGQIVALCLK